jgi:hypothetical protein
MSNPPRPSSRSIALTVPTHLAEALQETVDDFLARAAGGTTPAQRAADQSLGESESPLSAAMIAGKKFVSHGACPVAGSPAVLVL